MGAGASVARLPSSAKAAGPRRCGLNIADSRQLRSSSADTIPTRPSLRRLGSIRTTSQQLRGAELDPHDAMLDGIMLGEHFDPHEVLATLTQEIPHCVSGPAQRQNPIRTEARFEAPRRASDELFETFYEAVWRPSQAILGTQSPAKSQCGDDRSVTNQGEKEDAEYQIPLATFGAGSRTQRSLQHNDFRASLARREVSTQTVGDRSARLKSDYDNYSEFLTFRDDNASVNVRILIALLVVLYVGCCLGIAAHFEHKLFELLVLVFRDIRPFVFRSKEAEYIRRPSQVSEMSTLFVAEHGAATQGDVTG